MKRSLISLPSVVAAVLLAACGDGGGPMAQRDACEGQADAAWAGDVSLGVGEAMPLAAGSSLCLALPGGDREYVLAYADTRALEASKTTREPLSLDSFTVRVEGVGGSSSRASRGPGQAAPRPELFPDHPADFGPAAAVATLPATSPFNRTIPWAAGESFILHDNVRGVERPARVYRVFDGWLAVAAFTDTPPPGLEATLATLDAGWPSVRQVGMPLMREVFDDLRPVSSPESNQLLLLVRPDLENASGVAYGATDGANVFSFLALRPVSSATERTSITLLSVLYHEIAHAHQRSWMHASRPAGARVTAGAGATRWGIEGGAALMQRELVRRQAGLSLTANFDWREPGAGEAERWYTVFAQPGDGSFSEGYAESEDFMSDLVARLAARGMPVDAAVAAVERGSIEGWYGWTLPGQPQRPGLVARVRAGLGSSWEPGDALLTWAISHAMDDRTQSDTYQVPGFRRVGDVSAGEFGWSAHAALSAGSGSTDAIERQYGAAGYFTLRAGGSYRIGASVDGVRWMLARMR